MSKVERTMAADARRGWNNSNSTMVKNLNGTSDVRYAIPDLHTKYLAMGGVDSGNCQVKECPDAGSKTAHVKKTDGRTADDWYLCWVCAAHNHTSYTAPYALRSNAKLISIADLRRRFG